MSHPPTPVVQMKDVHVTYPGHPPLQAVKGVSFELFPGEVVGLVGESGSGKSTIAKVLAGLIKPANGQIIYQGNPVTSRGVGRRPLEQTGIQMVFQDPGSSLNPRRRVGSQIQDGLDLAQRRRRELGQTEGTASDNDGPATPGEWLERIGLAAKDSQRYPRSFSGGQRQRIATARALAAGPDVLIGDEPISALDASTQARVAYLMSTLTTAQGATLLFISHDLSVVRLIADRLMVMYAGQIVETGVTEQIWNQPRHPYTKSLLGAIPVPDGAGRLPQTLPPGTTFPPPLTDA
ncbi:MAG: ABC transporter ATP-binding protein [Micrococcales bacterium]|nr:ABC transporter ATP-binding protein [Micrococcales bacterium]